ncbi:MAG: hypothetical protein VW827_03580 [Alphaproteobacteria bacterium]
MKTVTTIFAIFALGLIILVPNSEVHSAKTSKFLDDKTTFTPENVIKDPQSKIHSMKIEYQDQLKKSNERLYSLSSRKHRLIEKISSNHGQIELLRGEGNLVRGSWLQENQRLEDLKDKNNFIFLNIEKLRNDNEGNDSSAEIRQLERAIKENEKSISLSLYELERLNIKMLDYANRIANLKSSLVSSQKELDNNLMKTKKAYAFEATLKRDLDKITTLEFDAALAGKDFGLTKDGDLKLLANASEIKTLEELLERQSDEYMSSYSAEKQISNSELLSIIQEEGF